MAPNPGVGSGGPRRLAMYFETVASEMSIPNFNNSPWIRGAPQSGLARHIRCIKCRISERTLVGRDHGLPAPVIAKTLAMPANNRVGLNDL